VVAGTVSSCSASSGQLIPEPESLSAESKLQRSDQALAASNLQKALEKSVSGKTRSWRNAESGSSGSVTPTRTWKTARGTYCRSYNEVIRLASGKSMRRQGVACRTPNAVWKAA
jgi:surface antigen